MPQPPDITQLLIDVQQGSGVAQRDLLPFVYGELRRLAHARLRGRGATLSTTALVHEAYLKLFDQERTSWNDRAHFFALAARVMRQILIDYFRHRGAQKRGGGAVLKTLDEGVLSVGERSDLLLALDEALTRLAVLDERLARVVELKFFAGMTQEEIAEVMGLSERTVRSDWRKAKAWLAHALTTDA